MELESAARKQDRSEGLHSVNISGIGLSFVKIKQKVKFIKKMLRELHETEILKRLLSGLAHKTSLCEQQNWK